MANGFLSTALIETIRYYMWKCEEAYRENYQKKEEFQLFWTYVSPYWAGRLQPIP